MLAAAGYLCCRDRIENGFLGVVEVRGEKSISWRCGAAREFPLPLTLDLGIAVDHFFSFSWDSLITVSWPKAPYERNDCRKTLQVQVLAGTSKCTQLARRSRSLLLPSMGHCRCQDSDWRSRVSTNTSMDCSHCCHRSQSTYS
jgi:hypothetical protein